MDYYFFFFLLFSNCAFPSLKSLGFFWNKQIPEFRNMFLRPRNGNEYLPIINTPPLKETFNPRSDPSLKRVHSGTILKLVQIMLMRYST